MPGTRETAGSFRLNRPLPWGRRIRRDEKAIKLPGVLKTVLRLPRTPWTTVSGLIPSPSAGYKLQAHRTGHLNTFVGYREIPGRTQVRDTSGTEIPISSTASAMAFTTARMSDSKRRPMFPMRKVSA